MSSSSVEPQGVESQEIEHWRDPSAFKPNRLRAWLAIATLALVVLTDAIYCASSLIEHFLLPNWDNETVDASSMALVSLVAIAWAAMAYLAATIMAAVAFLMWLYRAAENARVIGKWHLRTTPASAVFCWFIPILNLFRPYQVTKILYRASEPANPRVKGDWIRRAPIILPLWWAMWIVQILVGNGSSRQSVTAGPGALETAMWLQLVALPFCVISAVLCAAVLWSIQARQEARVLEPGMAYRLRDDDADAIDEDRTP